MVGLPSSIMAGTKGVMVFKTVFRLRTALGFNIMSLVVFRVGFIVI